MDIDSHPWIIWHIWKARNDNLFRGIDIDQLETVWHTESECHAWFGSNQKQEVPAEMQHHEHVWISERCMIDGSWSPDALFSGYGWTQINSRGGIQLMGGRNQWRRISPLHSELKALSQAIEYMLQLSTCQVFGTDCNNLVSMIQDSGAWPKFSTELNWKSWWNWKVDSQSSPLLYSSYWKCIVWFIR